jgi:hypothetical protein
MELTMVTSDKMITGLLDEAEEISRVVKEKFSILTFVKLNYRTEKYAWSAAECLDHLIVTNNHYIPLIEKSLEKNFQSNGSSEFKNTFAGKLLLSSTNPDNLKKRKTPRIFRPEVRLYTKDVVKTFLQQHKHIKQLIVKSQHKDICSIRVHSPVTRFLRFNLGECFQIILQHDWRHINQAGRILDNYLD